MTGPVQSRAVVIGAGPAGLAAAEVMAEAGLAVTIFERMPTVGRKFLMAGRGGLNLTHGEAIETFLGRYGGRQDCLEPIVRDFPPAALRAWADGLGQETFEGTSGRIFPKGMKASPLLRAWLARLDQLGVRVQVRHDWQGWDEAGRLRLINRAGDVVSVEADICVLALGGASWPRLGADGRWVGTLRAIGLGIAPLEPANAGIHIAWSDLFRDRFEGEPLKRVAVTVAGETFTGECVVTRAGLEGGMVYAAFARIRWMVRNTGQAVVTLDLRPGVPVADLAAKLAVPRRKQSTATFLRKAAGLTPLAIALAREGHGEALPTDPVTLARLIKAVPLTLTGTGDLSRAISTAGGVDFGGLDEHLMVRARPGLFIAGEMLDWEAPTGGYLLQATIASGRWAGKGAVAWLADHGRVNGTGCNVCCDDDAR